jgi:hypothetical protein
LCKKILSLIASLLGFNIQSRVARWFIFKPKIPIWVNFGGENLGIFYDHLEIF